MTSIATSWSALQSFRTEIRRRWPSVWNLPVAKRGRHIVLSELREESRLLDIGAHDRRLGGFLSGKLPKLSYRSMDIDREKKHDYYSLDEIDEVFDFVTLIEVIEHISYPQGLELLQKIHGLLASGGKLYLQTPNLHHPNRFWDTGHCTPYRYDEIGAILLALRFRVNQMYRIYNDSFGKRFFRLHVASPLHRYLDVDFAKSIAVLAQRD